MKRLALTLISLLPLCFTIFIFSRAWIAKANGSVYIRLDGSIDPPTAPILNTKNTTYTFMGSINASLIVERSHIIIDGAGYTVQGDGSFNASSMGVCLDKIDNVTIKNIRITGFLYSIYLSATSNSTISNCNLVNNGDGIYILSSSNNNFSKNTIIDNLYYGIVSYYSGYNTFISNNISSKGDNGIRITSSKHNFLAKNNITNNRWFGVRIENSFNNSLLENCVSNDYVGIWCYPSGNNTIFNNTITSNTSMGIKVEYSNSTNNNIQSNTILNNKYGVYLYSSANENMIHGNTIKNNTEGIRIVDANNNTIFHNNFINNTQQVYSENSMNRWDNCLEGNFWSSYTGNDSDNDGIGESWYEIDKNNTDHYPLRGMCSEFKTYDHSVTIISNSSISHFNFSLTNPSHASLTFNATGATGTLGFCRVCIPKALINSSYVVMFNGQVITNMTYPQVRELLCSNEAYEYLYINYTHSEHTIEISGTTTIPEYQWYLLLPLFILVTLLAVAVYIRNN